MGGFASSNQDYKAQSNSVFDTSIKTENYVSSNSLSSSDSSKKTAADTETVDLDASSGTGTSTKTSASSDTGATTKTSDSFNYNTDSYEDMEANLQNMSKDDYDQFIKEMKAGFDTDIADYEATIANIDSVLNEMNDPHANEMYSIDYLDENAIGGRKDEILNVLYWFVQDKKYEGTGVTREQLENMSDAEKIEYICKHSEEAKKIKDDWEKAKREEADPYIKEKFSHLGINTLDEYVAYKNYLLDTKDNLNEAIKTTKNMKDSCYYDYFKYTKDYADFKAYEPTEQDKKDVSFTTGGKDEDLVTYDYNAYKKDHPNVSPLEYVKMIKEKRGNLESEAYSRLNISGVDNLEEIKTIIALEELQPDLAKTYNYLYKNDPSKLSDYFEKSKYEFNNLTGQVNAAKFLNSLGVKDGKDDEIEAVANEIGVSVQGLKDGLQGCKEGLYYSFEAFMTAIGAWDENRTMSAEEYKRMYILYGLLSTEDKAKMNLITKDPATGKYVNSDPNSPIDYSKEYSGVFLSNNYEISQGIGNLIPSMVISAAITYVCPAAGVCTATAAASAGATAGAVFAGVSSGGNAYHNAMVSGSSLKSSIIYGIYTGTSTAITQRVLGSIPFLSNVKVSSIGTYLQAMGQQATQATVQGVLDSLAQTAILGNPLPQNEEELQAYIQGLFKSATYGAITSGILNLPALGTSVYAKLKFNNSMHKLGFTSEEIKSAIDQFRKDHPEYSKMTDNEIKKQFGSSLFNGMTQTKVTSLMKGINDDTIKIRSLDDNSLRLLALYTTDEDFDVVLRKLNLLNMSEEKLYNYKKSADQSSAMSVICDRVNKSHYIKRNLEGAWVEVTPGNWEQVSSSSSAEVVALAKTKLSENYEVLSARLSELKKQYGDDIDVDMYWRVANEKKTDRPDPSTYIKKDSALYKAWQADFSDGDAYCVYSTSAYKKFVKGYGNVGAADGQYVFGKSTYEQIEKVMNDSSLTEAQKRVKYTEILGFDDPDYFKDGIVMVKRSTVDGDGNLVAQPSTGRESTANNMYSPYLHTSGGSLEAVLPQIPNVVEKTITDPKTGRTYTGFVDKNTGAVVSGVEIIHSDMPKSGRR